MNDVEKLVRHVCARLDDLNAASDDDAYAYAAVPFCVIDAVFSLGVRYESAWRTVSEWGTRYQWEMCRWRATETHTTTDFMLILEPYKISFEDMACEVFNNRQRTSPKSGLLKAEAVYKFSSALQQFGVETLDDALTCQTDSGLRNTVESIPGQRSGLSYNYFLMLAGHEDAVKADRMVRGFVSCAIERRVTERQAEELVRRACALLKPKFPRLTPSLLDNEIWKYQRNKGERPPVGRHRITPWVQAARGCAQDKPAGLPVAPRTP
jgi:hypothetical protein